MCVTTCLRNVVKFTPMNTAFAYATDENYVRLTAVSLHSLLHVNPGATVIILADGISNASVDLFRRIAARTGGTLRFLDAAAAIKRVKGTGAGGYVSFSAYSRLFLPDLVGGEFDRIVYLDGDTLVVSSLRPLCELDLTEKPFAIGYDCLCNKYKKMIGLSPNAPYFNSGVLVMDVAEWQRRRCTERIFEYMEKVRHDFMFGDQDYFSLVLVGDAAILPPEYNFLTHIQMFKSRNAVLRATGIPACAWYDEEQYAVAQRQPAIHHFLGHTLGRPWYRESLNPLRETYRRFAAEAGVPEVAEQSRPVEMCYRVQHLCWRLLPQPLFAFAARAMYEYFFRSRYGV